MQLSTTANLSSLTDNGTGNFTTLGPPHSLVLITHTLQMVLLGTGASAINKQDFYTPSTSSVRLLTAFHDGTTETGGGTAYDYQLVSLIAHGDLA